MVNNTLFKKVQLDDKHEIYHADSVNEFEWTSIQFDTLWQTHPANYHIIKIHGKEIATPRWQQAYGKNYSYTGSKNNALPITETLQFFLDWCQNHIDKRLNGLLLNWYDGEKGHYIGAHRDDTRELQHGSPIVTISIGQERVFRMRPHFQKGYQDIIIKNGGIVIIPWHTNLKWTHEVPKFKRYKGKRISVTIRAFK